jgi:hypothetical protein
MFRPQMLAIFGEVLSNKLKLKLHMLKMYELPENGQQLRSKKDRTLRNKNKKRRVTTWCWILHT